MKKILAIFLSLFSISCFAELPPAACPQALPTDTAAFCSSFKLAATCHCTAKGLPASFCDDLDRLYNRMIATFGSLERACEYQKDTTKQICIDDWKCWREGGVDSRGKQCSGTGKACPRKG